LAGSYIVASFLYGNQNASRKRRLTTFHNEIAEAEFWLEKWRGVAEAARRSLEAANESYENQLSGIDSKFQRKIEPALKARDNLIDRWFGTSPAWSDPVWNAWSGDETEHWAIRFGGISRAVSGTGMISLPALLPFPLASSIMIKPSVETREQAMAWARSIAIRLLATSPSGNIRFTFFDPVGLGQNVAGLLDLGDYDEKLVDSRAWTESRHLEAKLADLSEHMQLVIQKYLRDDYASLEAYNDQAGEIAEPYRVLVVMDFPANFSESAAQRLLSIVQNGPRCGVFTIVVVDAGKPLPRGFSLEDLERSSTVIAWDGERFAWQDDVFEEFTLELDQAPPPEVFDRVIQIVGEAAREASRVEVPFERIAPPEGDWWTKSSASGLRVALGPAGARKIQHLELGEGTAHHVLVVGQTGSGKSTLLHTLITSLVLRYSPEEVQLYLVDFKEGVEFKVYATHTLPHARVIAIESEREFGMSVLEGLDGELARRGDEFRAAGVDELANYREKTHQPMPRILLLVDEFQKFFTEDDGIAHQSAQILDRLVRQGRAFGIHVLLGSQTLSGAYTLARSTIDQMAVRIALQCTEADSRLILADDNPAARLLSRPGEAIYNSANGLIEGNNRFQVAWLPDDQLAGYMERVEHLANQQGLQVSPIVFEGNLPATVETNLELQDLISGPRNTERPDVYRAWLGEPIAIRESVAAQFHRRSASNLLIVGRNSETALGLVAVSLVSLAAQLPVTNTTPQDSEARQVYVLDFGAMDANYAGYLARICNDLSHVAEIGRRRHLPRMITELAAEVQRRIDEEDETAPDKYLIVFGLQRARDLRTQDSFGLYGDEGAELDPGRMFGTILREGPDLGVHTIIWCDTVTNLNRSMDRRTQREFAMRVALQMSAEDSVNLIDTPAASKLGSNRALFYDEDLGMLEKFRPLNPPNEEWMEQALGNLAEPS
jgi:energy-coupling factor transporter ATP-binding protein EcfA2